MATIIIAYNDQKIANKAIAALRRELREEGLATFQKGQVTIHDFDRLADLAEFDRAYLDQEGPLLR